MIAEHAVCLIRIKSANRRPAHAPVAGSLPNFNRSQLASLTLDRALKQSLARQISCLQDRDDSEVRFATNGEFYEQPHHSWQFV
jgi:hypothetical protein